MNWSEIVRLLGLKEREKGVGDGTADSHKYTVVQRDDKIYIVLPDYPRNRCEDIVKKLLKKLKPEAEIGIGAVGHASSRCNYCLAPFSLTHRCHRCGGWYCSEHRLPERHNCPDEEGKVMTRRIVQKESKKEERKEKEKIIAVRLPCA